MISKSRTAWAIKVVCSPFDGRRSYFVGEPTPTGTRLFMTRAEARTALSDWKRESAWAFNGRWASAGGNRIYSDASVVPVRLDIREMLRKAAEGATTA